MSFGFPAYFTQLYTHDSDAPEGLRPAVRAALGRLKWHVREEHENQLVASTSVSLQSWGERILLNFLPDGSLSVTSKCSLPTQCFDWGKNKANVHKFIEQLGRHG